MYSSRQSPTVVVKGLEEMSATWQALAEGQPAWLISKLISAESLNLPDAVTSSVWTSMVASRMLSEPVPISVSRNRTIPSTAPCPLSLMAVL